MLQHFRSSWFFLGTSLHKFGQVAFPFSGLLWYSGRAGDLALLVRSQRLRLSTFISWPWQACRSAKHWPYQVLPACFLLAESGTRTAFPNAVDQTTCAAGFSGDQLVSSHADCSATRARLSSTLKRHAHRDHIITDSLSSLDGVQKSER